jgi:hypothetical protein
LGGKELWRKIFMLVERGFASIWGNIGEAGLVGHFYRDKPTRFDHHERHELHEKFKEFYAGFLSCFLCISWLQIQDRLILIEIDFGERARSRNSESSDNRDRLVSEARKMERGVTEKWQTKKWEIARGRRHRRRIVDRSHGTSPGETAHRISSLGDRKSRLA